MSYLPKQGTLRADIFKLTLRGPGKGRTSSEIYHKAWEKLGKLLGGLAWDSQKHSEMDQISHGGFPKEYIFSIWGFQETNALNLDQSCPENYETTPYDLSLLVSPPIPVPNKGCSCILLLLQSSCTDTRGDPSPLEREWFSPLPPLSLQPASKHKQEHILTSTLQVSLWGLTSFLSSQGWCTLCYVLINKQKECSFPPQLLMCWQHECIQHTKKKAWLSPLASIWCGLRCSLVPLLCI